MEPTRATLRPVNHSTKRQPSPASSSSCSHPPAQPAGTAAVRRQTRQNSEFPAPDSERPVADTAPCPPSEPLLCLPGHGPPAPRAVPPSGKVRTTLPKSPQTPEPCSREQLRRTPLD